MNPSIRYWYEKCGRWIFCYTFEGGFRYWYEKHDDGRMFCYTFEEEKENKDADTDRESTK